MKARFVFSRLRRSFVIRMRLERMTVCLEGRCSIQLSYRTHLYFGCKGNVFCLNVEIH